jgi:shikimate kinase
MLDVARRFAGPRTFPSSHWPKRGKVVGMPNPRDNIILIGFMGSGKSSVGRMLARRLRFQFLDTDHLVEERSRMSIKDIFAGPGGEVAFRERETAALESLLVSTHRHVIATGGGIVTQPRNVPLLRQLGWVVLLQADPDELYKRVARNHDRPLLRVKDPRARVNEMLEVRQPLYQEAAQFVIDSTGMRREDVTESIVTEARKVFGWRVPAHT